MTKHDIRCKGTKTDEDLLDEYFRLEIGFCFCYRYKYSCDCYRERQEKMKAIEKELSKDRIEKERLERRLTRLEARAFKPWYKLW